MGWNGPTKAVPMFRGARMPASSTAMWRSASRRSIPSSAARVSFGSMPRSASFAPSSRIPASVSFGTDQSSRAAPSDAVSPDTPALTTSTTMPFCRRVCASLAGNVCSVGRPRPAVSESPKATILTGRSEAPSGRASIATPIRIAASQAIVNGDARANLWTQRGPFPYVRDRTGRGHFTRTRKSHMDDTSTGATAAIALAGVNLSLGRGAARVHILKDLDLAIAAGGGGGLLRPSGGGKSTLLMVMAGLERPDTGRVAVNGRNLSMLGEDALARFRGRHVGIVFQSFHLIPTMTALENVAVALELAGVADAFDIAARELDAVGLRDRASHYPAELSGGEQQRVALARALAPNPAILVADEPTGNLDDATGAQIIDLLFEGHKERGSTLVLVTHDAALAERCGRVVHLRSGRIVEADKFQRLRA